MVKNAVGFKIHIVVQKIVNAYAETEHHTTAITITLERI